MNKLLLGVCMGLLLMTACSKKNTDNTTTTTTTGSNTPPATGTTLDKIRDSVFLYAKEDYYWYDGLPSYSTFNPRSFTASDDLTALQNEVNAISQYKINPNTGKPYEYYSPSPGEAKYSFIDEGQESAKLNAVTGDFGFAPLYVATNDLRVKYVYPGSPADNAGLKRGYQITSINGRTNISYDGSGGTNVSFVINAYAYSSTITMTLQKPDGTSITVNMNTATYKVNPILYTNVYTTTNGKKVGYIVFNSFVSLASAQSGLDAAFATFASQNITDLIVDLRYNGGGYVETAEYLDNLIAPATTSGSLMYTAYYNNILTSGQEQLLKNQVRKDATTGQTYNYAQVDYSVAGNQSKFSKKGSVSSLSRVFFIVTGSTASASELTINNLRPYMNVQLIGSTTYGKPVGFFDIDINKYQMYIPEFETKNSAGQGGYYTGMTPATTDYPGKVAIDDPTHDFGNTSETLLAQALNYVTNGVYLNSTLSVQSTNKTTFSLNDQNNFVGQDNARKFNGMVLQHHNLKK